MSIYFISDVHLGTTDQKRSQREQEDVLIRFLRDLPGDAEHLYILGDLFDFWFEYRSAVPSRGARVLFEIYNLIQAGIPVTCLPGNHDIWLGEYLADQVGMTLHPNPISVEHHGRRLFLAHGDEFRNDWKFRLSRSVLKNRTCISLFRMLHPDLGDRLAQITSSLTELRSHDHTERTLNAVMDGARDRIRGGHDAVVCGHYHRLLHRKIDNGSLVILGDWMTHDSYAVLNESEIRLQTFPDGTVVDPEPDR